MYRSYESETLWLIFISVCVFFWWTWKRGWRLSWMVQSMVKLFEKNHSIKLEKRIETPKESRQREKVMISEEHFNRTIYFNYLVENTNIEYDKDSIYKHRYDNEIFERNDRYVNKESNPILSTPVFQSKVDSHGKNLNLNLHTNCEK